MKKIDFIILGIILIIALALRLYKINTPLADFHSWRQADTAAVARNFAQGEFNLLMPRYDDLSNIQSGKENPEGYRFVEFPFYNALIAMGHISIPTLSITIWGRLISIVFSLITIAVIYYLARKETNKWIATAASSVYAVFPFFVFFSRVVLPEATALGLISLSIFLLYLWEDSDKKSKNKEAMSRASLNLYLGSLLICALAILVKPTVIFYSFTLGFLFLRRWGIEAFKKWQPYVFFIGSIIPFVLWRMHISQYPEGIPGSEWLFYGINTGNELQNIFFRPAFFRWIFFERIYNIILGGFASIFFILGIISHGKRLFFLSILFSALIYLFTFQGGNVQHAYYQTLILPAIALFAGIGIYTMVTASRSFNLLLSIPLTFVLLGFGFFMSFYTVSDWYGYPKSLVHIANIIQEKTDKQDKIITDTLGDTTLLYLANRRGAPAVFKDFEVLKEKGYKYFVTINKTVIDEKKKQGKEKLIYEDEEVALFAL